VVSSAGFFPTTLLRISARFFKRRFWKRRLFKEGSRRIVSFGLFLV
jgi:hypothetical protein